MARYQPDSEAGLAVRALADEIIAGVELPAFLRGMMPLFEREIDRMVEGVDRNPEAAREGLRPLVVRLVDALGIEPAELRA